MTSKQAKQFSKLFKTLGGEIRLNVIWYLASGDKCVCNIYEYLKLSQNLVSHHLAILHKNELIARRREGRQVFYSLNRNKIENLYIFLEEVLKKEKKKTKC